MHGHDLGVSAAENYLAFAQEARGRSPAPHLVALVRAGATFVYGKLAERPGDPEPTHAPAAEAA
jgi:hypothetical protein